LDQERIDVSKKEIIITEIYTYFNCSNKLYYHFIYNTFFLFYV